MKKVAALFLIIVFSGLFGCSGEKRDSEFVGGKSLIIGSDIYAPYFYIADDGNFTGIDVDIAREACKRMGVTPIFKSINWQNKDTYLKNNVVDCLWGSFSMTGREDIYDWAGPYLKSRQIIVVKKSSDIYALSDLNGKDISVQNGSKPEEIFLQGTIKNTLNPGRIYSFSTLSNVFAALKKGYVDACAGHYAAYKKLIDDSDGEYRILDEPLLEVELGVAFYKDRNPKTVKKLTEVLDDMKKDGTLENITEKYGLDSFVLIEG